MAAAPLKFLTVAARTRHTATVIFIHGLGDSGHGWKPVADMFAQEPALHHVKWVLPHAPEQSVTANAGYRMPSWFDIYDFGFTGAEDEVGMGETVDKLRTLINAEVASGIPHERIILGGFSQGGAMTLLTGLQTDIKFAGLVMLSTWLPLAKKLIADKSTVKNTHFAQLPLFWGHGQADPLVKPQFANRSIDALKTHFGVTDAAPTAQPPIGLTHHTYPGMGHSTCPQELQHLKQWLSTVIPTTP